MDTIIHYSKYTIHIWMSEWREVEKTIGIEIDRESTSTQVYYDAGWEKQIFLI